MSAQEILKMIEEVSPDDTAKLDEIDARVMAYLEGWEFKNYFKMYNEERMQAFTLDEGETLFTVRYTRSRDALKAIRPEGWLFTTGVIDIGKFVSMGHSPNEGFEKDYTLKSETLPTEELAELHAIIQAIEYERTRA